jgi:hypothetical protein
MAEQFGFPIWTLWGMGLSAFGALVAIILAFLAQSPRLLTRFKLGGQRLDLRARSFTGYGLALLLLAMGFFLAGVPLDRGEATTVSEGTAAAEEGAGAESAAIEGDAATGEAITEATGGQSGAMDGVPTPRPGGASGAMSGLITPQATLEPGAIITGTVDAPTAESALPPGAGTAPPDETPLPEATATRAPTTTPTPEPSPTPTPTPILVPTARINDETSTLPVRRLPGGPVLVVLVRGDTVIPLVGNAFHSGEVWQEIQTVDGVIGWVPDRFLDYGDS